jgi:hypothetical protein
MANKLVDMKSRLAELSGERDKLETAVEEMIGNMAELPPEQRSASEWGPDGASTKKYLKLTERLADVESEIIDLGRAIVESDEPASSVH